MEITENDLLDEIAVWIGGQKLPMYDPKLHVTYRSYMERFKVSQEVARKVLNRLEKEGKLRRIHIRVPGVKGWCVGFEKVLPGSAPEPG